MFDDTGTFEAISVADALLEAGLEVTMVGRCQAIGEHLPYPPATVGAARERLMAGRFDFIGGHHLLEITAEDVVIGVLFTDRRRVVPARTVVLVSHNQPNRDWPSTSGWRRTRRCRSTWSVTSPARTASGRPSTRRRPSPAPSDQGAGSAAAERRYRREVGDERDGAQGAELERLVPAQ